MKKIYSFDIFDTCLGRICGEARNLFYIMAIRIMGSQATMTKINDFIYIRTLAEKQARGKSIKEDISIEEIYQYADFSSLTNLSTKELITLEMDLEVENLHPIYSTLKKISEYHDKGISVVYISDMYLPSTFLVKVLEKNGFWKNGDKIYVSCEIGYSKSTGHLFDYVKKVEGPQLGKWVHYGDNIWSDFISPMKKGIICKYVKNRYTKYELYINSLNVKPGFNISSISSGISHSIIRENKESIKIKFASDLIAPIYVPFVYKILKRAEELGQNKIYFLSRDGYIFLKIAEQFKSLFPRIELNYLYASRKSLYLPGIKTLNYNEIKSIIVQSKNIKEIFDNFQIEITESEYMDIIQSSDTIQKIMSSDIIMSKITNRWKEQKKNCIEYFKQEGLADNNSNIAIVDLRGTRKSQICINNILEENGYKPVYAYYLEVTNNRLLPDNNNKYESIYFRDSIKYNTLMSGLFDGKYLLEHYFSITPFQRCSGYKLEEERVCPIFDNKEYISQYTQESSNINLHICEMYAQRFISLGIYDKSSQIMELGLAALSSFINNPNRNYLKSLLNVDISQTQHRKRLLIKYFSPFDFYKKNTAWYEGAIKLSYGNLGLFLFKKIINICKIVKRLI